MRQTKRSTRPADVIGHHAMARTALYKRFARLGYPQCPTCRDYVLTIAGHACERAVTSPHTTPAAA